MSNDNKEQITSSESSIRVLMVDDDTMLSDVVKVVLEAEPDIEFFSCSNSEQAIEMALRAKPTVIMQDLVMPGINGLELVRRYHQQSEISDVPVIVLSGSDDAETKGEAFAAGANDYMVKLPDSIELVARIRYHSKAYIDHMALQATIKRLQEAQDQLLQSEKMASIGQLAAGVAHEINNPVGFVSSNIGTLDEYLKDIFTLIERYETIESELPQDSSTLTEIREQKKKMDWSYLKEDTTQLVNECKDGLSRVKQIVKDLKDFSHVDEVDWQWADLQQGIESTLNIVNNEIKYKADVVKQYAELPLIECIPAQLNQVFMNLLVNAAHAIEERGIITLRSGTGNAIGKADKNPGTNKTSPWVWVSISDTGKGMDTETRQKIFDPFFTTKPVGQGTGLGLSLSYGIINGHGGQIGVESEPNKGTTFTIWLPIQQQESKAV